MGMEINNLPVSVNIHYADNTEIKESSGIKLDSLSLHAQTLDVKQKQPQFDLLFGTDKKNTPKSFYEEPGIGAIFTRGKAVPSVGDLLVTARKISSAQVDDTKKAEQQQLGSTVETINNLQELNLYAVGKIASLMQG